jgi:hypothetical protein
MMGFTDAMAQVVSPISDNELIDYIITGLGPQYESLQHSHTVLAVVGADSLSLADFNAMLLSCESLKEQNSLALTPKFSTLANPHGVAGRWSWWETPLRRHQQRPLQRSSH